MQTTDNSKKAPWCTAAFKYNTSKFMCVNPGPLPGSNRKQVGSLLSLKRCIRGVNDFLFWIIFKSMPDLPRKGKTVRGKQCSLLLPDQGICIMSLFLHLARLNSSWFGLTFCFALFSSGLFLHTPEPQSSVNKICPWFFP